MNNKPNRNDVCNCGSGKKYKACHGLSSAHSYKQWTLIGVLILAVLWFFFYEPEPEITPNRISSPIETTPPGKVWSMEHGHWHDASTPPEPAPPSKPIPKKSTSKPAGEAPPGKVWSAEHGHWHDIQ
ncbi:MAG: SEC-C domain-containing protein [Candidatus Marinimicrobia bacterium]|nr:SEC-C domain-containing protein [Candidatus Neomarinimicrobiota bacterium]